MDEYKLHHQVSSNGLYSPPSSPKYDDAHPFTSEPILLTPDPAPKLPNNKRPASSFGEDSSQPPKQRLRTTNSNSSLSSEVENKLEFDEGAGLRCSVRRPLDDLIENMEKMGKMVKRVGGLKGLMSDPVLACLVSSQTVTMACIAELISRTAPSPHHGQKNRGRSSTNGAVKKMKNTEN